MVFLKAADVAALLEISDTYGYKIIRLLQAELVKKGYFKPPAGRIPLVYFCERFYVSPQETEKFIMEYRFSQQNNHSPDNLSQVQASKHKKVRPIKRNRGTNHQI